ncbi:unnamed protein product [Ceutorhynchus assimilis]|uniref:Uncharacterized protein n=1 Tax=Ceutorhynchus assimilis TaxID=467358 RepID=A0A9N9QEI1_9CUCU|nr:unnamed protein product [Ceutorhynchus assimilis]
MEDGGLFGACCDFCMRAFCKICLETTVTENDCLVLGQRKLIFGCNECKTQLFSCIEELSHLKKAHEKCLNEIKNCREGPEALRILYIDREDEMHKKIQYHVNTIEKLNKDVKKLNEEIIHHQKEKEEINENLENLTKNLHESEEKNQNMALEITKLNNCNKNKNETSNISKKSGDQSNYSLQLELRNLEAEKGTEIKNLNIRISDLTDENREFLEKAKNIQNTNNKLKQELCELKELQKQMIVSLNTMEEENKLYNTEIRELKNKLCQTQTAMKKPTTENKLQKDKNKNFYSGEPQNKRNVESVYDNNTPGNVQQKTYVQKPKIFLLTDLYGKYLHEDISSCFAVI